MAAGNPDLEKRFFPRQKSRPASAPATKHESETAQLSAGQTDDYVKKRERPFVSTKPRHLQIAEGIEEREREETDQERQSNNRRPKTSPAKVSFTPSSVNIEDVLMGVLDNKKTG